MVGLGEKQSWGTHTSDAKGGRINDNYDPLGIDVAYNRQKTTKFFWDGPDDVARLHKTA
jgi:hypothetical protein